MNVYWDIDNRQFVAATDSIQKETLFTLAARDVEPITLAYLEESASGAETPYDVSGPDSGEAIWCAIKEDPDDANYLAGPLQLLDNGLGGDDRRFTGDLNLATAELIAAIDSEDDDLLAVKFEVTVQSAAGYDKFTTQVDMNIFTDVIRNGVAPATGVSGGGMWRHITDAGGNKGIVGVNIDGVVVAGPFYPPGV